MAKKEQKNKTPSAYDMFINSSRFEDVDEDIAYFSNSRKTPTAARETSSRIVVAPEKKEHGETRPKSTAKQSSRSPQSSPKKAKKASKRSAASSMLIAACSVTALLLLASLFTLASGDKQYSESENRYLAQRPHATVSTIFNGEYMKAFENYLSDQFAARDTLVKTRTVTELFFGKKEISNVYIGKDRFLFEKPEAYQKNRVTKTVNTVNSFVKKNKKLHAYFAIAPDASEVLPDYLPRNAPTHDQTLQIKKIYASLNSSVKCIDICSTLKNSDNKSALYYRSDHHWTTTAAEIAFRQIAANMKLNTAKVDTATYCVSNSFQGTLAGSSGLYRAKDSIFVTVPKTDVKYAVDFVSENRKSASMFCVDKLQQSNQYEVFFGGNFGQINISTTLNSKKELLMIKDSYANCLIPMLMPYYKEIVIIDPRYYKGDIQDVISASDFTDILFLYNANTFLADTSIANVLG